MEIVRYRHLISGRAGPAPGDPAPRGGNVDAYTVRELAETSDGSGSATEIIRLLQSRTLAPRDLVDKGDGWQFIEDCDEFKDVCRPLKRRTAQLKICRIAIQLALFPGLGVFVGWLTSRSRWSDDIAQLSAAALVLGWALLFPLGRAFDRLLGFDVETKPPSG
jgi:hypothetical protein